MASKSIDYFLDYVPYKVAGLSKEQQEARQKLLLFMEGDCSQEIKDFFVERTRKIVEDTKGTSWVIGFIPAPDDVSTILRYGDLAIHLGERTDCEVFLDLFCKAEVERKKDDYRVASSRIEGKGVLLIDSLITTGRRYRHFSSLLKNAGASSVHGLIVGRTHEPAAKHRIGHKV